MRYLSIGIALAALAGAAQAQSGNWGSFENGVGVQGAGGAQLLLKCDKPGKGSVYATVVSPTKLVPPSQTFVMRAVKMRFDGGAMKDDRWRFYETTAVAVNKTSEKSLGMLLAPLADAKKLELTLEPGGRDKPVDLSFDVGGARDAIGQVYTACKDTSPLG